MTKVEYGFNLGLGLLNESMPKPVGGRGKRAPYETVQMRVPLPIKSEVEQLIASYRNQVLETDSAAESAPLDMQQELELLSAIKLVDRFVEEIGQSDRLYLPTVRNNRNLAKFRDWLHSKLAPLIAP